MKEFKVVATKSLKTLEKKVNEAIEDGWDVRGITLIRNGSDEVFQTLMREKPIVRKAKAPWDSEGGLL